MRGIVVFLACARYALVKFDWRNFPRLAGIAAKTKTTLNEFLYASIIQIPRG